MMLLSSLRTGRRRVGWCFALALAAASLLQGAPEEWRMFRTPRFTLLTSASEKEGYACAADFAQFLEALQQVMTVPPAFLPPQTIVLFRREKDFRPYAPLRPDGRPGDFAGFYARRETWSVVGLAGALRDEELRRTIFHEGVHWYMSALPERHPLWLSEGLAEVFSTFEVMGEEARWGAAVDYHVLLLREATLLPLERLLWMGRDDPMFNESRRTSQFYAQSWAFVHYLMFGRREGERSALSAYLRASRSGAHPDEVFREVFGEDYAGMDRQLRTYLQRGQYFLSRRPVPTPDLGSSGFEAAAPELVEATLARLALGSGRMDTARAHAARAVELAPEAVGSWEAQAVVLSESDAPVEDVKQALQRAMELGSTDSWCRIKLADLEVQQARERGGLLPPEARRWAAEYQRAINAWPVGKSGYLGLARLAAVLEPVREQDVPFLVQGRTLFPDEPDIVLGSPPSLSRWTGRKTHSGIWRRTCSTPACPWLLAITRWAWSSGGALRS